MRGQIIDITVGISRNTPVYPGDPQTEIETVYSIESDGYAVSRVTFGTHTGTHVDAPSHILCEGLAVDRLPLSSLIGRAVVIDLSDITGNISCVELQNAFNRSGAENDPAVDTVLIKTHKGRAELCRQAEDANNATCGLRPDAGIWVLEHGFKLIGVDTLSVDIGASLTNHEMFLENGVIILENIDVSAVAGGVYHFICLPLKLEGCDAAPARVILIDGRFP
jgi:arylformamidase